MTNKTIAREPTRSKSSALSRLRVVEVVNGLDVGGAERMLVKVATRLDPDRFALTVISLTTPGPLSHDLIACGIPVRSLDASSRPREAIRLCRLVPMLARFRPDVVHTWLYKADLVGGLASRLVHAPVIWNLRQTLLDPELSRSSNHLAVRACARLSHRIPMAVTCASQAVLDTHVGVGYDAAKLQVIPNGFDVDEFRPRAAARAGLRRELGIEDDAPTVGLIARFDPQKDHQTFIRGVAEVVHHLPRTQFVLAGSGIGPDNRLLGEWIRAAGVAPNVHLLGVRRDVANIVAGLDVAVSSSAFGEGFSNAVGEAMASGVPCVVTDSGNSAELAGDTGEVVAPGDGPGLGAGIIRLLRLSEAERAARGAAARERIVSKYSIDTVVGAYGSLYEEVARNVRIRRNR